MFYGWGKNVAEFPMPDGRLAVCVYRYLSVMFIFKLAMKQRWYLVDTNAAAQQGSLVSQPASPPPAMQYADENAEKLSQAMGGVPVTPTTRDELATYFSPEDAPNISLWNRFSIVLAALGLVALIGIVGWTQRGTTSAAQINRADCFIESESAEIDRLTTPDCAEPHDSQVIGLIDLANAPEDRPADTDDFWSGVFDQCFDLADQRIMRFNALPEDTEVWFLTPDDRGWDRGDHEVICYIYSASGFDGSFITDGPDD